MTAAPGSVVTMPCGHRNGSRPWNLICGTAAFSWTRLRNSVGIAQGTGAVQMLDAARLLPLLREAAVPVGLGPVSAAAGMGEARSDRLFAVGKHGG